MKSIAIALGVAGAALLSTATHASEELVRKHGCMACHTLDRKMVGPAFRDIATKYRDDKAAAPKLLEKVKKGGAGVWGPVPMPPHAQVPDADLQAVVKWLLSTK